MENGDITTIEILDDDCLMEIFERLPTITDKIRIEGVSKRWQILSKKSWSRFRKFDFKPKTWGFQYYKQQVRVRMDDVDKVISLCGKYLTSVSSSPEVFWLMSRRTINLQELELEDSNGNFDRWSEICQNIEAYSKNITRLHLKFEINGYKHGECSFTSNDFVTLLMPMKNLNTLYLEGYKMNDQNVDFLNHLPFEEIEKLCFSYCRVVTRTLVSAVKRCSELREFCLKYPSKWEITIFEAISSHASTLKYLEINCYPLPKNRVFLQIMELAMKSNISKLKFLEKLDVSYSVEIVTDDVLQIFADNCKQLTHLDISSCEKISDKGINSISKLDKLIFLNIGCDYRLVCPPLEKFKNLKGLNCRHCLYLDDKNFAHFLLESQNLRVIDVSHCHFPLVKNIFDVAGRIFRSRNVTLEIFMDEETADYFYSKETSSFVKIGFNKFLGMDYRFE